MRSAVQLRMGITGTYTDALLPAVNIDILINNALDQISASAQWPWLLTSTSLSFAPSTATLPFDFIMARSLVYNGYPVQWIQLEDYLDPDRFFSPFGWTIVGNQARLTPAPTANASGTLYYYRNEPALVSDTDIPLLPTVHHNAVVSLAAYMGCLARQDESRASVNMADYRLNVNNMRDDLKQNTSRRIRFDRGKQYATWS